MLTDLHAIEVQAHRNNAVTAAEVTAVKSLYGPTTPIDRAAADSLFEIDRVTLRGACDPGWPPVFLTLLVRHLLGPKPTETALSPGSAAWLVDQVHAGGRMTRTGIALVVHIAATARGLPPSFNGFVLSTLRETVSEGGVIGDRDCEAVMRVVYGPGGAAGNRIDRAEADFLFDLNDATTGRENCPAWRALFVEAISAFLLEDPKSPGVVDSEESDWLVGHCGRDRKIDGNERALLSYLRRHASTMPPKLVKLLDGLNIR